MGGCPPLPLPKRETVSLIVVFRCDEQGTLGFSVCVDSQETTKIGGREYRVPKIKIRPRRCGNFDLAIAGSGNNGDVIDGAVGYIEEAVKASNLKRLSEIRGLIRNELRQCRKQEESSYSKGDLGFRLVICARSIDPQEVECWITRASYLEPMREEPPYDLVGIEESLYNEELERAYQQPRSLIQATILGVHVLSLARQTSRYIDNPFRVVVAQPDYMASEDKAVISELEGRLSVFSPLLADLLLSCPDTTMKSKEFLEKLSRFECELLQLRADYIQAEGERFLKAAHRKKKDNFPRLLLPKGSVSRMRVQDGRLTLDVDEDEVRTKKFRDEMRANRKWAQEQIERMSGKRSSKK